MRVLTKCSTGSRPIGRVGSGWLQKCYESAQRLVSSRTKRGSRDVEAAVKDRISQINDAVLESTDLRRKFPHRTLSRDEDPDMHEVESNRSVADTIQQSLNRRGMASLAVRSDSSPRLLSDEENARLNRKIDRLMAAIDERRPLHFAPDAETDQVEVFADRQDEVTDDDEQDLEQDIAAASENFGRIISTSGRARRIRSLNSLHYPNSTDSWASTYSNKSSSRAWERAVAAANIRFALDRGVLDQVSTVIKQPFRSSDMEIEPRRGGRLVHPIAPIPLDFDTPLRISTPSVHSNGSEQDTSSPLFQKSCERVLRETYAEPPESEFSRDVLEESQLDEGAFVSETRDEPPADARESKASSSTEGAFGVFKDALDGDPTPQGVEKLAVRSKALKDISNLRGPGYLELNSFVKDANSVNDYSGPAAPATASSVGFEGAPDPDSRSAYIKSKWPGLLEDRGNDSMEVPPKLDGVARRRNEQAIGRAIDTSHYSLSHVKTSVADSSMNADSVRQAHFDLALARLEGRAMPPASSPILRHPDSALLYDYDIQTEGVHRPLPLRVPRPWRPAGPRV